MVESSSMIFLAIYQVPAVGLIWIWRHLGIAYRVPFWAQYYTPLYCIMLALIMETNWQIYTVLQAAGWLDIEKTREVVLAAPAVVNITVWEDEASLEGYWPLIYFSLSVPLWMLGTFLICLAHTFVHAWQCRNEGLGSHRQRDLTIAFLALPVIYGMMSLRAVMDCWFVITNTEMEKDFITGASIGVHETWGELKDFFFQAFETNFVQADLYESLALLVFAQITMTVLRSRVLQQDDVESINNLHSLLATDGSIIRLAPSPSVCILSERTQEVVESLSQPSCCRLSISVVLAAHRLCISSSSQPSNTLAIRSRPCPQPRARPLSSRQAQQARSGHSFSAWVSSLPAQRSTAW